MLSRKSWRGGAARADIIGRVTSPTRRAADADDPVVATASAAVGGPAGTRVTSGTGWWTAVRVALAMTALACALGFLQKVPCRADGFAVNVYPRLCYTDIAPLYDGRGFAQGALPYVDTGDWAPLEYPVVTGAFMTVAAWLTDAVDHGRNPALRHVLRRQRAPARGLRAGRLLVRRPHASSAALGRGDDRARDRARGLHQLGPARRGAARRCPVGVVPRETVAHRGAHRARYGREALPAAAPRPAAAAVPARGGRMHPFLRVVLGAAWTWLIVNVPVLLAARDGWATFYVFSRERPASFGSVWYALQQHGFGVPPDHLNAVAGGLFVLACARGRVARARGAVPPPRGPAAVPRRRCVPASPTRSTHRSTSSGSSSCSPWPGRRWRDYLVWLFFEVVYFVAVWWYLQGLTNPDLELPTWPHSLATLLRTVATLVICGLVVRDVLRPEHDPVREVDPVTGDLVVDDPGGGVLDGAPDVVTLRRSVPVGADAYGLRAVVLGLWLVTASGPAASGSGR